MSKKKNLGLCDSENEYKLQKTRLEASETQKRTQVHNDETSHN